MAGPVACPASRLTSYSGTGLARHCRRLLPLGVALAVALTGSGCAVSGHLGALFGSDDEPPAVAQAETTGSIPASARTARGGDKPAESPAVLPPDADLLYAKAAVAEVLARGGKDMSASWENPRSGARGTVTPIAVAYTQAGVTCRDFLASHVAGSGAEAWMQGEACKGGKGRWEVRSLKPWKRS